MVNNISNSIPSREEYEKALISRLTLDVYKKMKEASVAITGLGGLGSNIAVMLARSGIGQLHIIDFDTVDITNLNRQAYTIAHIGIPKTEALTEILTEINPFIKLKIDNVYLDYENTESILKGSTLVCEAFDNAECKAMLVNTLLEKLPSTRIVTGSGMAGFGSGNEITTKRVLKNLYIAGDGISDIHQTEGLLASRVNICAGHQANMIIRLILGMEEA